MLSRVTALITICLIVSCVIHAENTVHGAENQGHAEIGSGSYINPVFAGDYPDPSIIRVGDDYYLTHSSFVYYPGLLIWHSKDMIHWTPLTRALHKNVGSVYAPELVAHNEIYYIYFPAGGNNYVITAPSPAGPWSDPVEFNIGHIDPGHVVGPDGKRYLYFSSGSFVELSDDGLSVTGAEVHGYSGWPIPKDWTIQCFCLEGPKLIFKDEYYYLTVAQGGTAGPATSHMVVSARSKTPDGPWENSPYNPIVKTYSRDEQWWSKGHGTLIDDISGNWWVIYHGYENGYYTLGRQTLLEPIVWTHDSWPIVPATIKTDLPIAKPAGEITKKVMELSDDFSGNTLGLQWSFYKHYDEKRFSLKDGSLHLKSRGEDPAESAPLLCMPVNHSYEVMVEMELVDGAKGGLGLFYNECAYWSLIFDADYKYVYPLTYMKNYGKNHIGAHIYLKLINIENTVSFYFSRDGLDWDKLERSNDLSGFHHNTFGGFLGLRIGLFATENGSMKINNFVYKGLDR